MANIGYQNFGNPGRYDLSNYYNGVGPAPTTVAPTSSSAAASPFENLPSLFGTGLNIYDQSQAYSGLQNALKTMGPTQLTSNQLTGPGGLTTGYNPRSGQGNINLGSLNPAFSGFAGAAGSGAGAYSAGLPSFLSGNALSTLSPAMAALGNAYGNYGAGTGAANAQLGNLGNFGQTYNNLLQAQYGQLAPQIQQQAFGLQNTLFGNGVANSTGAASGSLAAQNFGRGVGQAQSTAQLNAFQQALQQQNSAATNYGTLSNSANGILANAFNNFGNTNQLISGLNTAGLNNATTAAQGAGALNTLGLNNYNAGLQSSLANASARNQSLFPYASVASALSRTQTGLGTFGSALTQAGANGGGFPGLNTLNNLYQNYFGFGSPAVSAGDLSGYGAGVNSALGGLGGDAGFGAATAADPAYQSALSMMGPSAAGGGAADAGAGAMTASGAEATSNAAFDAYSASAAADAAGGAGAASSTAAGAGLGATAGALAAGGIFAAPVLAGMLTNPVSLTGKYWEGLSGGILAPAGSQQRQTADQTIMSMIATGGTKLPPNIDAYAQQNGLYQAANALRYGGSHIATGGGNAAARGSRYQQ